MHLQQQQWKQQQQQQEEVQLPGCTQVSDSQYMTIRALAAAATQRNWHQQLFLFITAGFVSLTVTRSWFKHTFRRVPVQ
jgi:sensor c-di-GMP phosphodiesterase-like protein